MRGYKRTKIINTLLKYEKPAEMEKIYSTEEFILHKEKQILCPKCSRKMQQRKGIYGYFLGCELYPICKGSRNLPVIKTPENTKRKGAD